MLSALRARAKIPKSDTDEISEAWHDVILHYADKYDYANNHGSMFGLLAEKSGWLQKQDTIDIACLAKDLMLDDGNSFYGQELATLSDQLWNYTENMARKVFPGFAALTVATHSKHLLVPLVEAACLVEYESGSGGQRPVLNDGSATIITFSECYFGLSCNSSLVTAMTNSRLYNMQVIEDEYAPSAEWTSGKPKELYQLNTQEEKAIEQVKLKLHAARQQLPRARAIVIVEPLCVESGRYLRPAFLKALRSLCNSNKALLVYDKTASAVRTGDMLFYQRWDDNHLHPDFVMLGSVFGAGVLMANIREKQNQREFQNVFSTVVPALMLQQVAITLTVLYRHQEEVLARCMQQGFALIDVIARQNQDVEVVGVGICLWVRKYMHALSMRGNPGGCLLPRLDQTSTTLEEWLLRGCGDAERFLQNTVRAGKSKSVYTQVKKKMLIKCCRWCCKEGVTLKRVGQSLQQECSGDDRRLCSPQVEDAQSYESSEEY